MEDTILSAATFRFADALRSSAWDMLGVDLELESEEIREGLFFPRHRLLSMIHFTGAAQGEFVLSLSEETALELAGVPANVRSGLAERIVGTDFSALLKELLNTAVGTAILGLEEHFGRLAFHPPYVVHGQIDPPSLPSGIARLRAASGDVECILVLDLADSEPERMLRQAMEETRRMRSEAQLCRRMVADLLWHSRGSEIPDTVRLQAEKVIEESRVLDVA